MSFSSDIKNELSELNVKILRHCLIAEIYALTNINISVKTVFGKEFVYISTDNKYAALRFDRLVREVFSIVPLTFIRTHRGKQNSSYYAALYDASDVNRFLNAINRREPGLAHVDKLLIKNECCKRSYLRGIFLSCGFISDPGKNYHMEFVFGDEINENAVFELTDYYGLNPKRIKRKNSMVIYFKEAEAISMFLNIIGAHTSLMEFESVRVFKDVGNNINRKVNCETANLSKTINASIMNEVDIRFIERVKGLSFLSRPLREMAELRLKYPDTSIRELGMLAIPPISKSGVNHRLRKISEIAELLRGDVL